MLSSSINQLQKSVSLWLQGAMLLLLVALLLMVGLNSKQPYLWYDEAVQFWVALGLTPDSPPFSTPGGLASVFESNRYYNLDPGGFGFLLHAWTFFTQKAAIMRLLPFSFFIISIGVCMQMAWQLTQQKHWAILGGFIPFLLPAWLHLSVELRAYSMEALGSVLCIAGVLHLQQHISPKRLMCWSLVFCFFITSRYTEVILVAITSGYVLYLIAQHTRRFNPFLRLSLIYAIPLLWMVSFIYLSTMRIQNADANSLFYLPYLSRNISMLWSKSNIVFNLIWSVHGLLFLLSFFYKSLRAYQALFFMAFASNLVLIILSIMDFHPWGPNSFRCLSLGVIQTTCTVLLLMVWLSAQLKARAVYVCFLGAISITLLVFSTRKQVLKRYNDRKNMVYMFMQQKVPANFSLYADYFEAPGIKYLFEYGHPELRQYYRYPQQFTLAQCTRHGFTEGRQSPYFNYLKKQPTMNALQAYDGLITPQLFTKGNHDAWVLMPGFTSVWIKRGPLEKTLKQ